jgi:vacuolar-type H+-ATPase subunit I/STV1
MCLLAACIMLPMIAVEIDEVMAMIQHMFDAKRRGESLWRVFWKGGSPEGCTQDERAPAMAELPAKPLALLQASIWGTSWSWTLMASAAIGVWLMFASAVFGTANVVADMEHLGGALIAVVAVICLTEVVRIGRYFNILLGLTIAVAPWFLAGATLASRINDLVAGLLVCALAIPFGRKTERYGMWGKWVR